MSTNQAWHFYFRGVKFQFSWWLLAIPVWFYLQHFPYPIALSIFFIGATVVHECGHALAARYFKCKVSTIEIGALGGKCYYWVTNATDKQRITIAAAGPITNLAMLLGTSAYRLAFGSNEFLYWLALANIFGLLNLLPIYPLDGGRILGIILRRRTSNYIRMTYLSSGIIATTLLIAGYIVSYPPLSVMAIMALCLLVFEYCSSQPNPKLDI